MFVSAMAAEKANAIVLRLVEFSETSSVVTLFTREFGRLGALAKGARRIKGPFDSALDLLTVCRIVFLRKSSGGLDILTEAKLERRFRPPGRDLGALYAAYYVAELLLSLTDEYDPHPELFDAADRTLAALAAGSAVGSLVLRFELTALRLLGHLPNLNACVECAGPVSAPGRIAFGMLAGGVLCEKCRVGKRKVARLTPEALQALRRFADVRNDAWERTPLDARVQGEVRGVVNHYMSNLLGHKPRMQRYLGFLAGIKRDAGTVHGDRP